MPTSKKDIKKLKKYALKLSDVPKAKHKLAAFGIFLIGLLAIFYLTSTVGKFVQTIRQRNETMRNIRVQVLNATSRDGLAMRVTDFLRKKGLDVIEFGNANTQFSKTIILDRADIHMENAKVVRAVLGQGRIDYQQDSLLLLHVTVILGKDYKERKN